MKKYALVTGSAKGLGASLIKRFAQDGYNVVINYLNSEDKALSLKKYIETTYNVEALVIKADITNQNDVEKLFKSIDGKLEIVINNAAYAQDNSFLEKEHDEFMRVLEVNVFGTFLVTKYASKYMNNGIVLSISSTDADDTYNELSMDYCASKAGVNTLTKTFSLALKNNKIIAVMLPWVKTEAILEMSPEYLESELKRTGQNTLLEPSDVADKIMDIINDKNIKSGSILRIGE